MKGKTIEDIDPFVKEINTQFEEIIIFMCEHFFLTESVISNKPLKHVFANKFKTSQFSLQLLTYVCSHIFKYMLILLVQIHLR